MTETARIRENTNREAFDSLEVLEIDMCALLVHSTTIYLWLIPLTASKELPLLLLKLLE